MQHLESSLIWLLFESVVRTVCDMIVWIWSLILPNPTAPDVTMMTWAEREDAASTGFQAGLGRVEEGRKRKGDWIGWLCSAHRWDSAKYWRGLRRRGGNLEGGACHHLVAPVDEETDLLNEGREPSQGDPKLVLTRQHTCANLSRDEKGRREGGREIEK